VLLAEDDAVVRSMVQKWLARWEYNVVAAADGREAWDILCGNFAPKLVILDWILPVVDGIELCRRVREAERDYYPYILMITVKSHKDDVISALEAGADDFLAKPFDAAELKARLAVANRMTGLQDDMITVREQLRIKATRDALTGLFNRAAFDDLLERELNRAARFRTPTGLLFLDLDRFKKLNDTYGHPAGDEAMKEVARRLNEMVRSYDIVGRYGGEEFSIALANCGEAETRVRAQAICHAIGSEPVLVGDHRITVTVSVGATVVPPGQRLPVAELIAIADAALYRAKNGGRNRTAFCPGRGQEMPGKGATPASRCAGCANGAANICLAGSAPWTPQKKKPGIPANLNPS
jgi:two-component system, cell cycle response regulator